MRAFSINGKKVPLALAVMILVITGAGAAAGVTFEGEVQGDTISKIDQAILVTNVAENTSTGQTANNALGKTSDDGTQFRFAANVNQGDKYYVDINVSNQASSDLNGVLTLNTPAPLEVQVEGNSTNLEMARTSLSTWNFNIKSGASGTFVVTIAIPDDASPGFYTIEGSIRPAEV